MDSNGPPSYPPHSAFGATAQHDFSNWTPGPADQADIEDTLVFSPSTTNRAQDLENDPFPDYEAQDVGDRLWQSFADNGFVAPPNQAPEDHQHLDTERDEHGLGPAAVSVAPQAGAEAMLAPFVPPADYQQPARPTQDGFQHHQAALPPPRLRPSVTVSTQFNLTASQRTELAKAKIAPRPNGTIAVGNISLQHYVGRVPAALREGIPGPYQDNETFFSEYTVDELLHGVIHPDDICGTIIVRMAKEKSGVEIAEYANQLHTLHGKQGMAPNGFTKRVSKAVDFFVNHVTATRTAALKALQQDRATYRTTGQLGIQADPILQPHQAARAAAAAQAASLVRAPAFAFMIPPFAAWRPALDTSIAAPIQSSSGPRPDDDVASARAAIAENVSTDPLLRPQAAAPEHTASKRKRGEEDAREQFKEGHLEKRWKGGEGQHEGAKGDDAA